MAKTAKKYPLKDDIFNKDGSQKTFSYIERLDALPNQMYHKGLPIDGPPIKRLKSRYQSQMFHNIETANYSDSGDRIQPILSRTYGIGGPSTDEVIYKDTTGNFLITSNKKRKSPSHHSKNGGNKKEGTKRRHRRRRNWTRRVK